MKNYKDGSIIIGLLIMIVSLIFIISSLSLIELVVVSIIFVIGFITFVRGILSRTVRLRGSKETGKVVKAWEETTTQTNNGATSCYTTYYVTIEYLDKYDELSLCTCTISKRIYKKLSIGLLVPIIVHKKRAIIDKKLI